MKRWFKVLHNLGLHLADTRWGLLIMFVIAFCDASFILLPASTMLLLLITLNKRKAKEYIFSATLGTLAGAIIAYLVGHFAWFAPDGGYTAFVQFLFNHLPGFTESSYNKIHILYSKWGFWLLCGATATPIPYGLLSLFSGVFDVNFFTFLAATLISQSIKYIILTLVTFKLEAFFKKLSPLNWKPAAIISTAYLAIAVFISNIFRNLY